MHAWTRQESLGDIRIIANFFSKDIHPENATRGVIFSLASYHASSAPNTSLQIDNHSPMDQSIPPTIEIFWLHLDTLIFF
jgi:hypothetical protein